MARSLRRLFWRGLVYAAGSVGVATGIYPVAPQIGLAALRLAARKRQPKHLVRIVASEWALAAALQAVRPASSWLPLLGPAPTRTPVGPRPIVVLHGFAQGSANFLVLAARLRRAGLGPLVGFEYWTLGRIGRAAAELAQFVVELKERTGASHVDLIGHSMGGIVARAYVAMHGGASSVKNLITIGTPHLGTAVSRFGLGWPTVELRTDSDFLRRLARAPVAEGVRTTCIWSRADGLVSSRGEAFNDGAEEIVYDDLGHMSLLVSRRVAREIVERLRTA